MRRRLSSVMSLVILAGVCACSGSTSSGPHADTGAAVSASRGAATVATPGTTASFKVQMTLDGLSVLPHRIHWYVTTSLSPNAVQGVQFFVDGRLAWVENSPPYDYADDGGYLVTSWLKPGPHRFTAEVTTTTGGNASDSVMAQVVAAPPVPKTLAGTWRRTVADTTNAPLPGSVDNPTDTLTPPGTYTISFERAWIQDVFPCDDSPCTYNQATGAGAIADSYWTPGETTFQVGGEVTFEDNPDTARLSGWWCETYGPGATYRWSVLGDTLTLQPVGGHDACGIRGFIWAGKWTKVTSARQ
jgi:hypothetical protein